MNEFEKAYTILGLELGDPPEVIKPRYKTQIMAWHPDRFYDEKGKKDAEEELRKINNAKDFLMKHFESGEHKEAVCVCQQGSGSQAKAAPPPPDPSQQPSQTDLDAEEALARQHDVERRRRAAGEATTQQPQPVIQKDPKTHLQSLTEMAQQLTVPGQDKLKWNIAKVEGALFIALCLFGWIGTSIGGTWHDWLSKKDNNPPATNTSTNTATPVSTVDPCTQTYPSPNPPGIVLQDLKDEVKQAAKQWWVVCKSANGAVVYAEDETGRLLNFLHYDPHWAFLEQWVVKYQSQPQNLLTPGSQTIVELWGPHNVFAGQTVYSYDQAHNPTEIRTFDAHQNQIAMTTVERTGSGEFSPAVITFFDAAGGQTKRLYQHNDPEMDRIFYLSSVFYTAPKPLQPAPSPAPSPFGTTPSTTILPPPQPLPGDTLADRLRRMNQPSYQFPSQPFQFPSSPTPQPTLPTVLPGSTSSVPGSTSTATSTDTGIHFSQSPFANPPNSTPAPSVTPGLDTLTKTLKDQNK